MFCIVVCRTSAIIKMNSLCELCVAYLEKRNIFQEVKEFQKQDFRSQNFETVMEWLKETVEISNIAHEREIIAHLMLKSDENVLTIVTKTKHLECQIDAWELKDKD